MTGSNNGRLLDLLIPKFLFPCFCVRQHNKSRDEDNYPGHTAPNGGDDVVNASARGSPVSSLHVPLILQLSGLNWVNKCNQSNAHYVAAQIIEDGPGEVVFGCLSADVYSGMMD